MYFMELENVYVFDVSMYNMSSIKYLSIENDVLFLLKLSTRFGIFNNFVT